jgi:cytochrome c biogenesis protein ResB
MADSNLQSYLTERDSEPAPKKRGLWAMLSTMKFAIWTLIVLGTLSLLAMIVGELYAPEALRRAQGFGPDLLRVLRMDDPFRSWWYRLLLGILSLSLFACVLERTPIIWRLWIKKPSPDVSWLKFVRTAIVRTLNVPPSELKSRLHGFRWRLKTDALWIGERGRIAMCGPLFTHSGMLLIALGALVASLGGTDIRVGGFAGDVIEIPGMPFSVRMDSFRVVYYPLQPGQWVMVDDAWVGRLAREEPGGLWRVRRTGRDESEETVTVPADRIRNQFNSDMDRANIKRYAAYVTVIENGREAARQEIAVNSPLRREGYRFYQSSYDPDHPRFVATFDSLRLQVSDTTAGLSDTIPLRPGVETAVPRDTLLVTAGQLLPHFKLGQQGAYSESPEFINPAVELMFRGPHGFEKSRWLFLKYPSQETGPGRYAYRIVSLSGERASTELMTVFEVRRSHGGSLLWLGFIFGTLGLILSFYVMHRVLYIEWPAGGTGEVKLTGLSRKTVRLFERELDSLIEHLRASA